MPALPPQEDFSPLPPSRPADSIQAPPATSPKGQIDDSVVVGVVQRPDFVRVLAKHRLLDFVKQKLGLAEPVPERATRQVVSSDYAYFIHVRQQGTGIGAVTVLVHAKLFSQAEIDGMVAQASAIVDGVRITNRRAQMAQQKIPVDAELNERLFPSDVEYFEAVMLDKFQFRKLASVNASTVIQPTVKAKA